MLRENAILDGTYQVVQEIGHGGVGVIYLAVHLRLQKYVVLKKMQLDIPDMAFLRNEADTLKELHHICLPQVYDFLQIDGEIYTVIDYIDGTDFGKLVESGYQFSEQELTIYMMQLTQVLSYLHGQYPPIVHSDIKPANIMLRPNGMVCLIDFGISVLYGGGSALYGLSKYFASPEQCQLAAEVAAGQQPSLVLDGRSDIYSLGVTMYYLMVGLRPGDTEELQPLSGIDTGYSADFVKIIERCMDPDPQLRYQTAEELHRDLEKHNRRGSDFRKKCIRQAGLLLLCGMLFCAGLLSLIYGIGERRYEEFCAAFRQVQEAAQAGDYVRLINDGTDTLQTFESQSDRSPANWYELLRAVADGYTALSEETANETDRARQMQQAARYYEKAAAFAMEHGMEEATPAMIAWACLLIQEGEAEKLQRSAEFTPYLDKDGREILRILQIAGQGDPEAVIEMAESIRDSGQRKTLLSGIYRAVAALRERQGDREGQIQYLRLAVELEPTQDNRRNLAAAYLSAAENTRESGTYYASAAELYAQVCSANGARFADRLNWAVSLRAGGDAEKAAEVVEDILADYPRNFEALTQAALIYSQLGMDEKAADYARRALNTSADEEPEILEILREISG